MSLDPRNGYPGAHADEEPKVALVEAGRTQLAPESLARAGTLAHFGAATAEFAPAGLDTVAEHTADRDQEIFRLKRNPDTFEVTVESDFTAKDYEEITRPEDWSLLKDEAEPLKGSKWAFINPTMEGGGVAMLRPTAVNLMEELGVEAHWYVMEAMPEDAGEPFKFTKQMHNVSQRMSDERITEAGKELHWQWADEQNGPVLEAQSPIQEAHFIVIDDPQPAPLIARLKAVNPDAKFIWRNHIDTDGDLMADPTTPQGEIASYLLDECGVRGVDAVIAHPVEKFVHRDPDMYDKTHFAPATFDPFDNLNRHLNDHEVVEGISFINREIAAKNDEFIASGREQDIQPLLDMDPERQRITLIARFDPSKGMDKAMEMGVRTRQMMREQGVPEDELPEVVIVGNGSQDDPDGKWMYNEMLRHRAEKYPEEADGITVMRLKHNYDAMNALMSRSNIVMQTSDAEGMETRISDAIKHGVPAVISNRGGMKTQVVEGKSGIILDYDQPGHDLERGAEYMSHLLTDREAYEAMVESTKEQARELNLREFITTANVTRFFRVANHLREQPDTPADKVWKIKDMVAAKAATREGNTEEMVALAA